MGDNVQLPLYGVVHAQMTPVITALAGQSQDLSYTIRTIASLNHDLAPKYASVGGTQIVPVTTVLAGSEPKWDGEMNMMEFRVIIAWLGAGWAQIKIRLDITWQVPGNPAFTDNIFDTYIGSGAITSKKDDVVNCKIGANCSAIWPSGVDPFATVNAG